jgi:hypothetical protein
MIDNNQVMRSSLIQSLYDYMDKILNDFSKLQPSFKYNLYFGTNFDIDSIQDKDIYNIVVFTGAVDKLPTHYVEIDGVSQLLYAGYLDVNLGIVNPISLSYTDDLQISTNNDEVNNPNTSEQQPINEINTPDLEEDDLNKIEQGTRLLEALSLYLTRKSVLVNDFKITSRADTPLITGQFDNNVYRLQEQITLMTKFVLLNDIGKSTLSGEDYRVWINFIEDGNDNWVEFYEVFDLSIDEHLDSNEYPKSNNANIQSILNHIGRTISISSPYLRVGANEKLRQLLNKSEIKKIKFLEMKIYNGKVYEKFNIKLMTFNKNTNRDKFDSVRYDFRIVSDIEEVGEN